MSLTAISASASPVMMEVRERPKRANRSNIFEILDRYQTAGSDIDESDEESEVDFSLDGDPDYTVEVESTRSKSTFAVSESDSDSDSDVDPDQPGPSRPRKRPRINRSRSRSKSTSPVRPPVRSRSPSPRPSGSDSDSNPASPQPQLNMNDWTQNLEGFPNIPTFSGDSGLKFDPDTVSSPGDAFALFIMRDMIKLFKSETNRYARQTTAQLTQNDSLKEHSRLQDWKTVTEMDMDGFLLILIHMSLVLKHQLEDYWSLKSIIHTDFASEIMPRNRFQAIMSMFHLNDNTFYNHLRNTFPALCVPDKNISIDEAMCGWRGKLRFSLHKRQARISWHQTLHAHGQ